MILIADKLDGNDMHACLMFNQKKLFAASIFETGFVHAKYSCSDWSRKITFSKLFMVWILKIGFFFL